VFDSAPVRDLLWAGSASVVFHAALTLVIASAPLTWGAPPEDTAHVTLELLPPREELPPEPRVAPAPTPRPTPSQETPPSRPAASRARPSASVFEPIPRAPLAAAEPEGAPTSIGQADREPAGPERATDRPSPRPRFDPRDLDPSAVARSFYQPTGPGPSRRGRPAGLQPSTLRPLTEEEAEARHGAHLRRQAMARPWLERETPRPRRQPDGSYVWTGHGTTARILPDGEVRFDHDAAGVDLATGSGHFDLGDLAAAAQGQNPYSAREEWFMRHTEALREQIDRQWREGVERRALARLRGRLSRTWDDPSQPAPARRRALFTMWDETADDELGAEVRRRIIAFVRERLPRGSEDAFTDAELRALNRGRERDEAFAP